MATERCSRCGDLRVGLLTGWCPVPSGACLVEGASWHTLEAYGVAWPLRGMLDRAWLGGSHGLGWVRGYSAELGSVAAMGCGEYGDTVLSLARWQPWAVESTGIQY
eukprot:COSAG02_NODE_740_length_17807_cov_30.958987_3_plen_106_part_00